jgi:oligosaccharide repeat unit polymerase
LAIKLHRAERIFLYGAAMLAGLAGTAVVVSLPVWLGLSSIAIVVSLWAMHKSTGLLRLRILTIPGFCYLTYLFVVVVPSFVVYVNQPDPFRDSFLFAVESALFTIPLGVAFTKRICLFRNEETAGFFNSPIPAGSPGIQPETYVLLLGVALIITLVYLIEVRTVPLFYMLAHPGDVTVIDSLREQSGKLSTSSLHYLYGVVESTLFPFLIVLGFGAWLATKCRSWAWRFAIALIAGVLFAGASTAKAPVATIFLVLCAFFYLFRRGKVRSRAIVLFLALFLAFPVFVTMQKNAGHTNFRATMSAIGRRMFYTPAECLYYYFEVFPHAVPYQHGRTIGRLAILAGDKPADAANIVGRYMFPEAFYSINATAPFIGNLNADFGMTGVLVGGLLAGVVLQSAQIYVVRRGKSILTLAIYASLLRDLMYLNTTALPIVILSQGTVFVILLAWSVSAIDTVVTRALRLPAGSRPVVWPRGALVAREPMA